MSGLRQSTVAASETRRRLGALLRLYGAALDPSSIRACVLMGLAVLAGAVIAAAAPLWLKAAIDALAASGRGMKAALAFLLFYGLTLLLGRGISEARWLAYASIDQRLERQLTAGLFERALRARDGAAGDTQSLTQGLEGSRLLVQQVLLVLAPALLELAAVLMFLCVAAPAYMLVVFAAALAGLLLAHRHGGVRAFASAARAYERRGECLRAVADGLANAETARLFAAEAALRRRLDRRLARAHWAWRRYFRVRAWASLWVHVGAACTIVLALGVAALGVANGSFGVGVFVLLHVYAFQALAPIETLALGFREALQYAAAASRLTEITGERGTPQPLHIPAGRAPAVGPADIIAEKLSRRSSTGRLLLDDITFTIPAGAVVGLVGRSGCGKSTLARLLVGLDAPTSGRLSIGGCVNGDCGEGPAPRQFLLAAQTPSLFDDSLRFNIALDDKAVDDARVLRAAREAGLGGVVAAHPKHLARRLGVAGGELSGGERQRVALARLLAREPALMVLDEATSGLDRALELEVLAALRAAAARRAGTLIVITHRLDTLDQADLVLVLDRGRLVESGAPADLLRRGGHFARLRFLQDRGAAMHSGAP